MTAQPLGPAAANADQPAPWIPNDSTFGARLALIRQWMGWGNVKEAALACGVPVESWRTWERDNVLPRDKTAKAWRIAERSGCDYGWLVDGQRLARIREGVRRTLLAPSDRPSAVRPTENRPPGRPRRGGPDDGIVRPKRVVTVTARSDLLKAS